jgi:ABC-type amino acid transport substrate-binding protein
VAKGLFNDPSKVEFVVQSSDARIPNLLTDKVDMSCQFITVTASRAQQVAFTLPYYREGVGLLLPATASTRKSKTCKPPVTASPWRCCKTSMPKNWCIRRCPRPRSISTTAST